jgi:hypothetical protein
MSSASLGNHRFAQTGWIKPGNLTGLRAGGREKPEKIKTGAEGQRLF